MDSLLDHSRIVKVQYPRSLTGRSLPDDKWTGLAPTIRALNQESLFELLKDGVNCYAVHTKLKRQSWQLRYIGQTDSKRARYNITQQLAPQSGRTSSVCSKCREAVAEGYEIGLRLIMVEPDTLRYFIQEKAIAERGADWPLDWN
jgi:hypothetical protein